MKIVFGLICSIILFSFLIVKIIQKKDKMDRAVFEKICCMVCLVNFSKVFLITIVAIQKNRAEHYHGYFLNSKGSIELSNY